MPRLIWVFAGRTVILLVLSCHGSFFDDTWCFVLTKFWKVRLMPCVETNQGMKTIFVIPLFMNLNLKLMWKDMKTCLRTGNQSNGWLTVTKNLICKSLKKVNCKMYRPNAKISAFGRVKIEPPCHKTNKMAGAPSEDSDQPGHPPN